jgi:hypothetical protein
MRSVRVRSSKLADAPRATWFLDTVQPSRDCALPHDSAHENGIVITFMIATVILAVTYGAFWHDQPARSPNDQSGDPGSRLGRLVNRALEWLVLMPHLSNPVEKKVGVLLVGKGGMPCQAEFLRPRLRALRGWKPWRRILVELAAIGHSMPAHLFKPKVNTNELAAGKTT